MTYLPENKYNQSTTCENNHTHPKVLFFPKVPFYWAVKTTTQF